MGAPQRLARALVLLSIPPVLAPALPGPVPALADDLVPTPTPNVNASRFLGNQSEATIAINPTDPDNVVILSNVENGVGLFEAYSLDGGVTWSGDVIANGDALGFACCDPSAAFDAFGNLFLTYLNQRANDVRVALSVDGGVTFAPLATVDRAEGAGGSPLARGGPQWAQRNPGVDQPTITTGPGSVWVTYKLFAGGDLIRARGAPVAGLGQVGAFGPAEPVPGSANGNYGDVAVGPEGEVMVAYQDGLRGEGPGRIHVNVDPDGLGPAGFGERVTVTRTNVGGFDYIRPQSFRSVDAEAGLAWDRSGSSHRGRVYLVYTDEAPPEYGNTDVYVRFSDDDGDTWSPRIRVNDDATKRSQFLPRIAADQTTGAVAVAFHDARSDAGDGGPGDTDGRPNTDAQLWMAFLDVVALSFGPNLQVSAGTSNAERARNGIDYGDYTGADFVAGTFRPAWADNSNSTGDNPNGTLKRFDIYTAAVTP